MCALRRLLRLGSLSDHDPRPRLNWCGDPNYTASTKPRAPIPTVRGAVGGTVLVALDADPRGEHFFILATFLPIDSQTLLRDSLVMKESMLKHSFANDTNNPDSNFKLHVRMKHNLASDTIDPSSTRK